MIITVYDTLFCLFSRHSAERQQGQRSSYSFLIELRVPIGTLTSAHYTIYIGRTKALSPIVWSLPDAFNSVIWTTERKDRPSGRYDGGEKPCMRRKSDRSPTTTEKLRSSHGDRIVISAIVIFHRFNSSYSQDRLPAVAHDLSYVRGVT